MEKHPPIYTPENKETHLSLSETQKTAVRDITLGIEEVDEMVKELAVEDVIRTLENGHPLNKLITDQDGEISGYIACEDFIFHEAYIKYFGTTKSTGRSLLSEIPAFLEYAKSEGYTTLNFHGWNARLNRILERFGFSRLRTDSMAGMHVNFYEKKLVEEKSSEEVEKERIEAFEQKYITQINKEYQKTLGSFGDEIRPEKEQMINQIFETLRPRLESSGMEFNERQKIILKLKLARFFQKEESIDVNVLLDAIIETPKFINIDKGGLSRLLEIHIQKTMQKVAELRKERAEIGEGDFNPYEALFQTPSGDYYMARLLNMPHLEDESLNMGTSCVGTSDHYFKEIVNGNIEILSLRHVPKINPKTQKLEGDRPVITIEYDLKSKTIRQMKKYDDEYLMPDDSYYRDVLEALKQLRTTKTDTGELRDFKKINENELQNFAVEDYHILTENGEVHFKDFNPESDVFVLKMGRMDINSHTPKEDAVKIMYLVERITVLPEQIAYTADEITENTKAYVGQLEPGIFQKLPENLEHVYTSFPEKKIRRESVEIGGKTKEQLIAEMEAAHINISDYAKSMMENPDFVTGKNKEEATLIRLTVADLGFKTSATTDQIYERAQTLGLELCPPDTGPNYRLKYKDQPLNEWIRIGMKQIAGSDGDPYVFFLERDDGGLWLGNRWAIPDFEWDPGNRFVFRLRKSES